MSADRTAVWDALADLFVAKELQDYDYRAVASQLRASGYSIETLEHILREEVAPVFHVNINMLNPTPELEAWPREFVREKVASHVHARKGWLVGLLARFRPDPLNDPILRKRWEAVVTQMAAAAGEGS